jgi:hypothetical protein
MTERNTDAENFLKMIDFEHPDWIPAQISMIPATWFHYGEALEELVLEHPALFPNYQKGDFRKIELSRSYRMGKRVDIFGTTWENIEEGQEANPVLAEPPLSNWDQLATYELPDPLELDLFGETINWEERKAWVDEVKAQGDLAAGGLWHGAMYMRLYYVRGYENFMIDVAKKEPRLQELIDRVLSFNSRVVQKWVEIGVDYFDFRDDLGIQKSLPISPKSWRQYIKPSFQHLFGLCRDQGVYVALHTDGHILDIIPDLIECGVQLLNPQVRPNTLEGLAEGCKGKVALKLDLDRQLFPFATPQQLRDHIHQAVDTLALPEGGLMLLAECNYDVPLDSIESILSTLDRLGCRGYRPL